MGVGIWTAEVLLFLQAARYAGQRESPQVPFTQAFAVQMPFAQATASGHAAPQEPLPHNPVLQVVDCRLGQMLPYPNWDVMPRPSAKALQLHSTMRQQDAKSTSFPDLGAIWKSLLVVENMYTSTSATKS